MAIAAPFANDRRSHSCLSDTMQKLMKMLPRHWDRRHTDISATDPYLTFQDMKVELGSGIDHCERKSMHAACTADQTSAVYSSHTAAVPVAGAVVVVAVAEFELDMTGIVAVDRRTSHSDRS